MSVPMRKYWAERRTAKVGSVAMPDLPGCHCAAGWICEDHPSQPFPHGSCPGPEMRCGNPECPWWRGCGSCGFEHG